MSLQERRYKLEGKWKDEQGPDLPTYHNLELENELIEHISKQIKEK